MKKHYLLSLLLASFLIIFSFHGVHAQGSASISGDELCGATAATKCSFTDIKTIVSRLLVTFFSVGGLVLVVFAGLRLVQAEIAVREGNAGARMVALKNIWNGLLGLLIIIGVVAGLLITALQLLGANSWVTGLFRLISDALVPHAYAADERLLPNPLGAYNLFDLIAAVMNLIIRFFIYPAIVVLWVWSGFQFVYARGNPDGLKKAKSWLLWSFLITVIMFTLQGFTLALRNTMTKIVPNNPAAIQAPASGQGTGGQQVTRDPNAPADGAPGSACTTSSGGYGIRGTDGSCTNRSGSSGSAPVSSCTGQNEGTLCMTANRLGTCTLSQDTVFGCYVLPTSCTGLPEGTQCAAANRLGTCTLSDDGSTFQCFVTPGQ